ncbi:MAG: hypothetical protein ACJARX_001912 [Psychroserpens sp.]|jgi:hypothetical protein|uniref:hypothetical protein n=1 Tax=Psychroserpens sp. TaxID=2020870 RepID=UPI0039E5FC92
MKNIFITVILLLVLSCKNEQKIRTSYSASQVEAVSILDTLELKLDNGKKWIANAETHQGVKLMDSIILVFEKEGKNDYVILGDDLSKQTGYIIKNCSMKGKPHDQLHVVLVPMLDEISILREQINTIESRKALYKLERLISAYFTHFKIE